MSATFRLLRDCDLFPCLGRGGRERGREGGREGGRKRERKREREREREEGRGGERENISDNW